MRNEKEEALPPLPEPDGWAVGDCYYPNPRTKIAMGDIRFGTAARRYTEEQVRAALAQRQQVPLPEAAIDEQIRRQEEEYGQLCDRLDLHMLAQWAYARAALAQRQQVPEGWQLVPVEPTPQMERAAFDELELPGTPTENGTIMRNRVYRAMLAAAPALTAAPSAPAEPKPCGQCRKADSWGIPLSKTCVYDCKFEPLNATDK